MDVVKNEFKHDGPLPHLLLRYTQALAAARRDPPDALVSGVLKDLQSNEVRKKYSNCSRGRAYAENRFC